VGRGRRLGRGERGVSNGGGRVVELLPSMQRWHTGYPRLEGVRKAIVHRLNDRLETADSGSWSSAITPLCPSLVARSSGVFPSLSTLLG